MEKTPVLDIRIEANGNALHLKGEAGEVGMIPFKGAAEGTLFRGIVEPCGVDTQSVNAAGVRHMLTGADADRRETRITWRRTAGSTTVQRLCRSAKTPC